MIHVHQPDERGRCGCGSWLPLPLPPSLADAYADPDPDAGAAFQGVEPPARRAHLRPVKGGKR